MKSFDKVMCLLFFAPPAYMLLRFIRWYMKSEHDYQPEVQPDAAE